MSLYFRRDAAVTAELTPTRVSQRGRGRPVMNSTTAMQQSVIWASLNLHAAIESMMPAKQFRTIDGIMVPMPLAPVLRNPSDFGIGHPETLAEFGYARRMALKGWGNYFAEITQRNALGLPAKFQPIPVEDVRLKIKRYQIVEWRFGNTVMDPDRVWHERGPVMAGNPVGLSPIGHAMHQAEISAIAKKFLADWFGNSATPGGILRNKTNGLTRKQRRNIKADYDTSVTNGEVLVTGSEWEWIATQAKAAESGFMEAMNYSDIALCQFMDTPANMIDVATTGSARIVYANITQANLDFMVTRMGPDLMRTDDAYTRLTPSPQFVTLDREAFLVMDPVSRSEWMKTQIESRLRTPTELRHRDNFQPYTEADYAEFDRLFGSKNQTPSPKGLPA